jgi:hypothetical protein
MSLQQYAQRPEAKYNCTVVELYAGLPLAWNSQAQHETEFVAENTQYTPGLAATRKAAIDAAQQLPDGQASGAIAEGLRIHLLDKLDLVVSKWHSLDGYIANAFKEGAYKPKIEAAGKQYYRKAAKENWEYAKQLLVSMKTFLTANEAALLSDGGMPANFISGFDTLKAGFDANLDAFKAAQQNSIMQTDAQTDAKIIANNTIYAEGRTMMEDGKRIFRKNAAVRNRFIWKRILELLTPHTTPAAAVDGVAVAPGGGPV